MLHNHLSAALLVCAVLGLGIGCATAPKLTKVEGDSEKTAGERFEARVFKSPNGGELKYRFLKPADYNPRKAYPLILFMHGAGERGSDNTKTLKHFLPQAASDAVMKSHPCFVIAPQVPEGEKWCAVKGWTEGVALPQGEMAPAMRMALEAIEQLRKEFKIDSSRMYVTGVSMGGYGTWDLLWRQPALFAAAAPICGGGDPEKAALFVNVPLWAFHGGADKTVPTQKSRDMIEALKKAGGTPKYTEYPGVGHDSWTRTYKNPEFYEWLFAQKKK